MNILANLERQSKLFQLFIGFALIGGIGILDFLSGNELAFSVFYVLPISLITWLTSRQFGLAVSLTSAFVWYSADLARSPFYSFSLIPIWNALIRFAFFVIITLLLSALKRALQREVELARVDYLTGAINSRFFYYLAQNEIYRLQRYHHPFTLAYFDLDNFKAVNDQFGHTTGDQILCMVVNSAKTILRKTDVVARLGGDEFALILPETNPESASVVLSKLQNHLSEEMQQNNWPITFSMGVLTCITAPATTDELVKMADDLMYSAKREGKNALKYAIYSG